MIEEEFEPAILGRQFKAQRIIGSDPNLPQALLEVALSLSGELSLPPLCFSGVPPHLIDLDASSIALLLEQREQLRRNETYGAFCLSDHPNESSLTPWLGVDPHSRPIEEVFFGAPEKFSLDILLKAIEQVCLKFGAFYGYVWDSLIAPLHGRSIRGYELSLSTLSPEERQFVPRPLPIQGVPDTLPPLLLCSEFDYTRVPDGVWWINFWSSQYVETVGLDRVLTAGWYRVIECPNGCLLLVATQEPTDVRTAVHRKKLEQIVKHLGLRDLQEYCKAKD